MDATRICRNGWVGLIAAIVLASSSAHCAEVAATGASAQRADVPIDSAASSATKQINADSTSPQIEGGQVNGRWREGSRLVERSGSFKLTGDRVTFVSSDGKLKFDGLENLAIERIARTIADSPDPLEWSISGLITEYRGANYLLVTQAVLKTKATRARRAP